MAGTVTHRGFHLDEHKRIMIQSAEAGQAWKDCYSRVTRAPVAGTCVGQWNNGHALFTVMVDSVYSATCEAF